MGDEPPAQTGVEIRAGAADAMALLRAPGLAHGKVDTPDMRFKRTPRLFEDGSSLTIAFKGREYRFEVRDEALALKQGSASQHLIDNVGGPGAQQEASTTLVRAGDLGGDGQLDFLLEGTGHDSESLCLSLSRAAAPGALAGLVGCLGASG